MRSFLWVESWQTFLETFAPHLLVLVSFFFAVCGKGRESESGRQSILSFLSRAQG